MEVKKDVLSICGSGRRLLTLGLVLLILVSAAAVPVSAAETGFCDTATHLRTSFCEDDYLDLTIEGSTLNVKGCVIRPGLHHIQLVLNDQNVYFDAASGEAFSASVPIRSDEQILSAYLYCSEMGWGYTWDRIKIIRKDGEYCFAESLVRENNREFYDVWLNPADYRTSDVSAEVKALSDSIVGQEQDDYQKLWLINRWAAENLYYDYDYYYGRNASSEFSSDSILNSRKTVCEGYSNIVLDLIAAQNIPCIKVTTAALGVSTNGGSYANPGHETETSSNHANPEAYVDGRWVIMDPTWDSLNKYENGSYNAREPEGFYYFDITPEAFALDHKIISRGPAYLGEDGSVQLWNVEAGSVPSPWAKAEVGAAISADLVPDALQGNYQGGITRLDMAKLMVRLLERASGKTSAELLAEGDAVSVAFTDTDDPAVQVCSALGIVGGVGNNCYNPDGILTRAQIAAVICRVARILGVETEGYTHDFDDAKEHWCSNELGWPAAMHIIEGVEKGRFDPDSTLTTEQSILIAQRALNALR